MRETIVKFYKHEVRLSDSYEALCKILQFLNILHAAKDVVNITIISRRGITEDFKEVPSGG